MAFMTNNSDKPLKSWIWVAACSMDEAADQPELLFNSGDGPAGWTDVRRFVLALERSGIRSPHPRPIRIGESGPDSYVID
jgi:hypothetical protein